MRAARSLAPKSYWPRPLAGSLADGQVIVDAEDGVVGIVLDGVDISSSTGPAIYILSAQEAVIVLADNAENRVSDGGARANEGSEDVPTAAIFSMVVALMLMFMDFSRFPLGARKVGLVAATGKAVEVNDVERDSKWIARPEWARREGVLGFGGQPLLYKGEVLGVLAAFTRYRLKHEELVWMRMIADHAATAIVNARAFEEIQRLQGQLELECSYLREEQSQRTRLLRRQIWILLSPSFPC